MTLTDLKEAQRSSQDRLRKDEETVDERFCLRKPVTDDGEVKITEELEATETSPSWRQMDEVSEEDECRLHIHKTYWEISLIHLQILFVKHSRRILNPFSRPSQSLQCQTFHIHLDPLVFHTAITHTEVSEELLLTKL